MQCPIPLETDGAAHQGGYPWDKGSQSVYSPEHDNSLPGATAPCSSPASLHQWAVIHLKIPLGGLGTIPHDWHSMA